MRIVIFAITLILSTQAWACEIGVYKHEAKSVYYTSLYLYLDADKTTEQIILGAGGTGMPYRWGESKAGKVYTIEPVTVYQDVEAILINDVLYRPDCP